MQRIYPKRQLGRKISYDPKSTKFYKNINFFFQNFMNQYVHLETDGRICSKIKNHNYNKDLKINYMFTNGPDQIMKIHHENYDENLCLYDKELTSAIKELMEIPHLSDNKANDLLRVFMSTTGNLFLCHYQWHLNEAESIGKEHAEVLRQARPFLRLYGTKLENLLTGTFEDFDEWDDVCYRRTYIEAFNLMFGKIISIDVEDIEEYMQQRKEDTALSSPDLIPANTPKSHWWWWN